jgi:squalene-hopene/tetraprenyl-beta-curcumene cyclase
MDLKNVAVPELGKERDARRIIELEPAIEKARTHLLGLQNPHGYWVGELEADASVSAGYIPLMYFMTGRVDPEKRDKAVNYALSKQKPDGSWSAYYGGPGDLNVSIQVYFALKLAGIPASEGYMEKARAFILSRGGVMQSNTITRIWLALFGQYDWRGAPSIPPELILCPRWFYFNIYEFASWSRETIMALIIVVNTRPVCRVPESASISELYVEPEKARRYSPARRGPFFSWQSIFLWLDRTLKLLDKQPVRPFHSLSMKKVEKWVVEHQEADGSWGGIMLPWVYSLMALKSLGYPPEHPVIVAGMKGLDIFIREDRNTLRLQPAVSPVWDTAWAALALRDSGLPSTHQSILKAGRWLLTQQVKVEGDWKVKNPGTPPGSWAFEFHNNLYPDIDDTAVVARALLNLEMTAAEEPGKVEAVRRGFQWMLEMQSRDGGWAAFDRDNNKRILAAVPYADFMTPLDPTSADVTAHALELAGRFDPGHPALKKALQYIRRIQQPDGSWYGRWGVNYIYGTGLVLVSVKAAGQEMSREYVRKAVSWLKSHQNPDGGWGETCETYAEARTRGIGPSTPSQTAWALMGLIASGEERSPGVENGINYLLRNQIADGSWQEEAYTGTGFPRAFYLRYDLYRIYFPLLVLGQYRSSLEGQHE